jgi:cytoskeletal protein RodZ
LPVLLPERRLTAHAKGYRTKDINGQESLMKLLNPKTVSVSLASVGVAFLSGMALTAHPVLPAQRITGLQTTTSTTTAVAGTVTDPTAPAPSPSPADTTSSAPTAPAADPSTTTTSASSAPADTTPPADPTPAAPAVTAVSAAVTGWSDPQPTDSKFGLGCPDLSRCPYSDGSTRQQEYETKYSTVSGGMSFVDDPALDCTVANAPAVN